MCVFFVNAPGVFFGFGKKTNMFCGDPTPDLLLNTRTYHTPSRYIFFSCAYFFWYWEETFFSRGPKYRPPPYYANHMPTPSREISKFRALFIGFGGKKTSFAGIELATSSLQELRLSYVFAINFALTFLVLRRKKNVSRGPKY